jgi:hypothetical protein
MGVTVRTTVLTLAVSFALFVYAYGRAVTATSRVYVTALCAGTDGKQVQNSGEPIIELHDQAYYGDYRRPALTPVVHMQPSSPPFTRFYVDVPPGSYDVNLGSAAAGAASGGMCSRNGPLIVLPNRTRSIFIAGSAIADWHAAAAIAGSLPANGVRVQALVYDRPKHCGDAAHSYDQKTLNERTPPRIVPAENDDGAYYANFHAYGTQDRTIALQFEGALFTRGTVLVTTTPTTAADKPPFIVKDITPAILQAAINGDGRLVCAPGF